MAASYEKTILSCLEEDTCIDKKLVDEKEHSPYEAGGCETVDDSSIFKSFFLTKEIEHPIEKPQVTQCIQASSTIESDDFDDGLKDTEKLSANSRSLSNHLKCVDETEDPGFPKKIECKEYSESFQHESKLSTHKEIENEDISHYILREDYTRSENRTLNGGDGIVKAEKDNLESSEMTTANTIICDISEKDVTECKKDSDSPNRDKNSHDEKINFSNVVGQELSHDDKKCNFATRSIDSCVKQNGCFKEKRCTNYTQELFQTDLCKLEEENLSKNISGIPDTKPMHEKIVNTSNSKCEGNIVDPFDLSGDEDFSPKAYKPIKRKLNQGITDSKASRMDFLGADLNDVNVDEKRQKLLQEEDLSLSDMNGRKPVCVAYVHSKELVEKANRLIRIDGRAQLVHSLIEIYGILQHVKIIPPRPATESEITGFHCSEYMNFLKTLKDAEDLSDSHSAEAEAYGLSYDCPVQEDVFETASLISGATITAAESLINGPASIAINWCGGWHHAKRDSASGFCYINDIVLGILKLREKFDKVLYVDLDLHHGDGVEEAFYMTPKVMTVSFHKYAFGFFPGSGSVEDTGSGRGRLYSINVPLLDGIGDRQFFSIFTSVMKKVREKFNAEAVVIQCGADALSEDPMASFNLTHVAIAKCVCFLLTWNLPTLLLGGGGYNFPNTAKCWTFLTAMAAGKKLPVDIPEHEHLMEYGPSFELTTSQGNRKDCNTKEHFYEIMAKICKNLNSL